MDRLPSRFSPNTEEATARRAANLALVEELQERLAHARAGGSPRAVERHRARDKMLPRERIEAIIDPGTAFLETSPLAANGLYDDGAPSAGIVTGIGVVHGRECLFVANDATVKEGSYFPMTVKKHIRAQVIAHENHLPCVYLVDSGGAFLPMQDEVFPDIDHFGRIFEIKRKCPRTASRKWRPSSAPARPVAPMCRPCPMNRSSSRATARFSSPVPRWSRPPPAKR